MDTGCVDLNSIWAWGQQEDVLIFTVFSPPSEYHQMRLLAVCEVTLSSSSFFTPSDTLHYSWPSLPFKATINAGMPTKQGPHICLYNTLNRCVCVQAHVWFSFSVCNKIFQEGKAGGI